MQQIYFLESVSMNQFTHEISQKLDQYEAINDIKDVNAILNDCLRFLPKHLQENGD